MHSDFQVQFKLSKPHLASFYQTHIARSQRLNMIIVGGASVVWVFWGMKNGNIITALISLLLWAALFAGLFYFLRRYALKKLLENADPSLFEKQNWRFSEQGLQIKGQSYHQDVLWENIVHIIEKPDVILLYTSKSVARILPKEVLTSEQLQFLKSRTGMVPG